MDFNLEIVMTTSQKGTDESVLVVCLYQSPLGETFIPLVRSDKWAVPYWKIPGGGVERGEVPFKAINRELSEETGLIANGVLLVKSSLKSLWGNNLRKHVQYLYVGNLDDVDSIKTTAIDGDQTLTIELFSRNEILEYFENRKPLHGYEILNAHAKNIQEAFDFIHSLPE